jgi:AcrR family transcriptional regulator
VKARSTKKPFRPSARKARERLFAAGRKAFSAKGLGGASLREDILAVAGVSAGSFYHQFADKADLLVEILRHDGKGVIQALQKNAASGAAERIEHARDRLLHDVFDMAERNPAFVRIFVREYHSDSPAVRREIRRHSDRTIAHLKLYYDALRDLTGLPLDTEAIATLLSVQSLSVINYYLDLPRPRRVAARERLITRMIQLGVGGVLAMRKDDA